MIETQIGSNEDISSDNQDENLEIKKLTREEILRALKKEGPLRLLGELVEKQTQKDVQSGIPDTVAALVLDPSIKGQLLAQFKTKNSHLEESLAEHEILIGQVIDRAYLLGKWPTLQKNVQGILKAQIKKAKRDIREKVDANKEEIEKAIAAMGEESNKLSEFGSALKSGSIPIEQSVSNIAGVEINKEYPQVDKDDAADNIDRLNHPDVKKFRYNPKKMLDAFVGRFKKYHDKGPVKPRTSKAAAKQMVSELKPLIDSLNRFEGSLKHVEKWDEFRFWSPSKWGISRGAELATSYMETSANVTFLSALVSGSLGMSVVGNSPAQLAIWATSMVAAFGAITLQSLRAKGAVEKEFIVSKTIRAALANIAKKHKAKLLAVGISTMSVNSIMTDSFLTVEQSKMVQQTAQIEDVIGHIEGEIGQVAGARDRRPFYMQLFESMTFGVGEDSNAISEDESMSVVEVVESMPDELRYRLETTIKAEAGVPEAVALARSWGMPLSGKEGIGPLAIALGQLLGYSVAEVEALTGMTADIEIQQVTSEIQELRANVRAFALENGLDEYLDEDSMENPQIVIDALAEQFEYESGAFIKDFSSAAEGFLTSVDEINTATTLSTMGGTLFAFSEGVKPEHLRQYGDAMQQQAGEITDRYNRYGQKMNQFSRIMGGGIKSIYVANDSRAQSIDISKIAITPPTIKLDFTYVNGLVQDIESAMSAVMNPALDESSLPDEEGVSWEKFEEGLAEVESRAGTVLNFITKRDEWDQIMKFRHGDAPAEENESRIAFERLKTWSASFGIVLAVFFAATVPMMIRQRKIYKKSGKINRENIARAEDKIAESLKKLINKLIHENRRIANIHKNEGLAVEFPYDEVSVPEIKRAFRAIADKDYMKKNFIQKLFARSAYTANMDEAKDYSNFMFDLQHPKQLGIVLDVLLPGWSVSIQHMRNLKEGSGDSGDLGTARAWKKTNLNPRANMFASEIAVRTAQNEDIEYTIKIHEAFLKVLKTELPKLKGKKGNERKEKMLELIKIGRSKNNNVELPEHKWIQLMTAAEEGSVVENIKKSIKENQAKLNRNNARINTIYQGITRNPLHSSYIDKRFEGAFKSKYLKPKNLSIRQKGDIVTASMMKKTVQDLLRVYRGSDDRERAFEANEGYFEEIFKEANKYLNERPQSDTPLDQQTKDRLDKRVSAVTSVVESTKGSFQNAINKEFFGSYHVETTPVTTYGDGEGASVEIVVRSGKDRNAPVIVRESVQISDILVGAVDKNKNIAENIGKNLVGTHLWKAVSKGSYNFKPGAHNNDKKLLAAYNAVWDKLYEASEKVEIPAKKAELLKRAKADQRKSISVQLIEAGSSEAEIESKIKEGWNQYLAHLRAVEVEEELKSSRADTHDGLKQINELFKPSSERIVPTAAVRQSEVRKYASRLHKLYESSKGTPGISASFDFRTQRFQVNVARWLKGTFIGRKTLSPQQMDEFLREFIAKQREKINKRSQKEAARGSKVETPEEQQETPEETPTTTQQNTTDQGQ